MIKMTNKYDLPQDMTYTSVATNEFLQLIHIFHCNYSSLTIMLTFFHFTPQNAVRTAMCATFSKRSRFRGNFRHIQIRSHTFRTHIQHLRTLTLLDHKSYGFLWVHSLMAMHILGSRVCRLRCTMCVVVHSAAMLMGSKCFCIYSAAP